MTGEVSNFRYLDGDFDESVDAALVMLMSEDQPAPLVCRLDEQY